jgi:putative ABC transport system permease protein
VDLWENVQVALGGLVANKMRAILTMLGVVIGVAAVIALLAIGEGAQASITDQITSVGSNLLFVMPGAVQAHGPGAGIQGASGSATTLIDDDAEAIANPANVPSASIVAPEYSKNTQIIFGDANINASVVGVTTEYQNAYELAVASGRFIEDKDMDKRATVTVLGHQAAEDLFGGFDPVGQKIKVVLPDGQGRVSLTVVGVLEKEGDSVMGSSDDRVYVPISTAQTKLFNARNPKGEIMVSRVSVVAASDEQAEAVQSEIEALLRERHDLAVDEDDDFTVVSQADMLSMASTIASIMTIFLGSIAGISLVVGGIGIMNIMLVSVTERTREIGLRKAVGARKSDVLMQFLMEAVVLSLLGGLIGILLGVGVAQTVAMTGLMSSVVTMDSVLLAVTFSAAVGLFFGIYPANRAAGLNPIEALRYE